MLYQWLETQRALMRSMDAWAALATAPWGLWLASPNAGASGASGTEDDAPIIPSAPSPQVAAPGCDWAYRLLRATPEPPAFAIESVRIGGRAIGVVETVVDRTAFCTLRGFERGHRLPAAEQAAHDCVLLVTPLAGHHAVMLRETVETLLQTHDVYVTDWANVRDVPLAQGRFGLSDYVLVLERFLRLLGARGVHVLAVCQAAPPALAAAALTASTPVRPAPLSVTLMGGPIDARLNPTMVDRLAATHDIEWFRHAVIDVVPPPYAGAGRRIYPGYVQHAAIVAAHPHRQLALESRYWKSRLSGDADAIASSLRALSEYSAVLDMDEDYFLDTLRVVFQEQRLARGRWAIGERRVAPEALSNTALCTVEGDRDDITGAGQTHAAHDLCCNVPDTMRMRSTIQDCDHYDLFTGPRWHDAIYPALRSFWNACARNQSANAWH
jgi:polyhydroxyalkanoate depolymerase